MTLNSKQGRMAALNQACPWRGPLVRAEDLDFGAANRTAADFMYGGFVLVAARRGQTFSFPTYRGRVITNPSYNGAIRTGPG